MKYIFITLMVLFFLACASPENEDSYNYDWLPPEFLDEPEPEPTPEPVIVNKPVKKKSIKKLKKPKRKKKPQLHSQGFN